MAAASLVIDYVLNVAVSVAAGVAALTSAFPALLAWTPELCVVVLLVIAAINLRGIAMSARLFALPAAVFVVAVLIVVGIGLIHGGPVHPLPAPTQPVTVGSVGILLVLAAFGNGCAALTGVEAIANATPSFRKPRQRRARTAEAGLGLLLGVLLISLAVVIDRYGARPVAGRTILSLVTEGSLGNGVGYVVVQLSTVVLLALAANTSYGGLPVLAAKLAADDFLPHVFGLRADRMVHRYGVFVLAALSGALLIGTAGNVNILVPLFAIGVFVGFLLCQVGMFRHWREVRGRAWRWKAAFSVFGAAMTAAALLVVTASKFLEGGWLIVLVLPLLLVVGFTVVRRAYQRIGAAIDVDAMPAQPRRTGCVVVVPVVSITRLAAESLSTAMSMGDRVVALHVAFDDETEANRKFAERWQQWRPDVPLVMLDSAHRTIDEPIVRYVKSLPEGRVVVLIGEIEPTRLWERILRNRRGRRWWLARSVAVRVRSCAVCGSG
ncbi:APC family permease [Fodinicola feengrottensis]|uniref:APC family permease n=1 Tax=Fodinicola feengrottensis TaxID=435914 RepID=UPI0024426A56|nr:amino acid permease [Fodinicola feengrottensis]